MIMNINSWSNGTPGTIQYRIYSNSILIQDWANLTSYANSLPFSVVQGAGNFLTIANTNTLDVQTYGIQLRVADSTYDYPYSDVSDIKTATANCWAYDAKYAWSFMENEARFNSAFIGPTTNTANFNFSRASSALAKTSNGQLQLFASGEKRINDRGFLLEQQRTNLILHSQNFGNSYWTKANTTLYSNVITALDGSNTGMKLVASGGAGRYGLYSTNTNFGSNTVTFSVFLKAAELNTAFVSFSSPVIPAEIAACVDLTNGTISNSNGTANTLFIESYANGWYRVGMYANVTSNANTSVRVYLAKSSTWANGVDPITPNSGIYCWGAQVEAFVGDVSSYIPTTTATATRLADSCQISGLSVTGPFSLYTEYYYDTIKVPGTAVVFCSLDQNTDATRNTLGLQAGSTNAYSRGAQAIGSNNSGSQVFTSSINGATGRPNRGALNKQAARFDTNDTIVYQNGNPGAVDNAGDVLSAANTITIGGRPGGGTSMGGNPIARIAIFNRALSNTELESLTT